MSDQPQTICPKCENRTDDFDGLGLLYCEHCSYCTHASITDGKCDFCGWPVDMPEE